MTLPDCPRGCDAAQSLEVARANPGGSIWCVCRVCAKECLVKDGRVVYPVLSKTDVSGRSLNGP
jgi:hypothetical protein